MAVQLDFENDWLRDIAANASDAASMGPTCSGESHKMRHGLA
jgi:hypothetical protein